MEYKELIIRCFNEYNGTNPEVLDELYDPKIVFEDPLIKVKGLKNLKKYYKHAYSTVSSIDFDFKNIVVSNNTYTCEWDMTLTAKPLNCGKPYTVRGLSLITFSKESSKIISHNDYLDIGDMVYERLPVFGGLIRKIKSRLS
jgi:hypothetical protein